MRDTPASNDTSRMVGRRAGVRPPAAARGRLIFVERFMTLSYRKSLRNR
jgi:hypothetical protein